MYSPFFNHNNSQSDSDDALHEKNGIRYYLLDFKTIIATNTQGEEVGTLTLSGLGEGNWLDEVRVDPSCQRQGVATTLIELALSEIDSDMLVACVAQSSAYEFSLTGPGEALIESCVRKNILPIENLRGVNQVPLVEGTAFDPGYVSIKLLQFFCADNDLSESWGDDYDYMPSPPPSP